MQSTSLPLVIIFENHWDMTPKLSLKKLLPMLANEGYDTFCLEGPQNLTGDEIISCHNKGLEEDSQILFKATEMLKNRGYTSDKKLTDIPFTDLSELIRGFVSSTRYEMIAEKIIQLPCSLLLKDIFKSANDHSFLIKGIDMNSTEFDEMRSVDLSQRIDVISNSEDQRIETFTQHLLSLRNEREGVVFSCGAAHADTLMSKLKKHQMFEECVYYFPHSSVYISEKENYIDTILKEEKTLDGHAYNLSKHEKIPSFCEQIVKDVKSKNTRYKKEIAEGNSQTKFLNNFFGVNFKTFVRPGYYVDALLACDQTSEMEHLLDKLENKKIDIHFMIFEGQRYLVIPNINMKEVAHKIFSL